MSAYSSILQGKSIAGSFCKVKPFTADAPKFSIQTHYRGNLNKMQQLILTILFIVMISACSSEKEERVEPTPEKPVDTVQTVAGCKGCHAMQLDATHDFECTTCHSGTDNLTDKTGSHQGLISQPAHPDNMMKSCGQCHRDTVLNVSHSLHFTVKNEVNMVRKAFGAQDDLASLTDIPPAEFPVTLTQLADDVLRRRCLRCHPYTSGDRYPDVNRGTGCASCHLQFYKAKLISHSFLKKPTDTQCLQCHYDNHVGADYYGRYDHDMNDEYRTPYTTSNEYFRPYGIEFHQLAGDVHQEKGMVCVDCHFAAQLMRDEGNKPTCAGCHQETRLQTALPANVTFTDDRYVLQSENNNALHPIPLMKDPAHETFGRDVGCQVCHAQWAFNDNETHLLRSDLEEYEDFQRLTVQGSSEIEKLLLNNLDFDAEELPHGMTDKITGRFSPGVWYKGFTTRRWETVTLGRDSSGTIQVMRPMLDLSLSWIDEDENVRYDSIHSKARDKGLLPYTPHTTGKAGIFYRERIENFLNTEKNKQQ